MGNPVSIPSPQAQPDELSYGIDVLALFQSYTRDSYQAAFGVSAPPWDPTPLQKAWFDTSVDLTNPSALVSYQFVGQDNAGNWGFQPLQMTAAEAASVNLPGAITYPAYVIAPTGAMRGTTAVAADYLSMESDADALMAEIGGTSIFDEGQLGTFPVIYPAGEQRRMWAVNYGSGKQQIVGLLLQAEYANGVGAPGHWDMSSGDPVWVPDPPAPSGLDDTRPPRPMPARALLANESLQPAMTGIGPVGIEVVRVDLALQAAQQSGAFLPSDRQMLEQILALVTPPAQTA